MAIDDRLHSYFNTIEPQLELITANRPSYRNGIQSGDDGVRLASVFYEKLNRDEDAG